MIVKMLVFLHSPVSYVLKQTLLMAYYFKTYPQEKKLWTKLNSTVVIHIEATHSDQVRDL